MPNGQPQTDREILLDVKSKLENYINRAEEHFQSGKERMGKIEDRLERVETFKSEQPLVCQDHKTRINKVEDNQNNIKIPSLPKLILWNSIIMGLMISIATLLTMNK